MVSSAEIHAIQNTTPSNFTFGARPAVLICRAMSPVCAMYCASTVPALVLHTMIIESAAGGPDALRTCLQSSEITCIEPIAGGTTKSMSEAVQRVIVGEICCAHTAWP